MVVGEAAQVAISNPRLNIEGDSLEQKPAASLGMTNQSAGTGTETKQQHFERVLACEPFKGLKAILDNLSGDRSALCEAVNVTHSYDGLLARLGYRITLTKQIHIQDCYSRVGSAGGIKAVLPYYDLPTQSSLPTLVNFDSTVT